MARPMSAADLSRKVSCGGGGGGGGLPPPPPGLIRVELRFLHSTDLNCLFISSNVLYQKLLFKLH